MVTYEDSFFVITFPFLCTFILVFVWFFFFYFFLPFTFDVNFYSFLNLIKIILKEILTTDKKCYLV